MDRLPRVTEATLDVLEALIGPDDELYGYKIAARSGRKTGVIYPILDRLEEAGWITSAWEREQRGERGPRRRFYRLTPDGLSAARDLLEERRGAIRQRGDQQPARGRPRPALNLFLPWIRR